MAGLRTRFGHFKFLELKPFAARLIAVALLWSAGTQVGLAQAILTNFQPAGYSQDGRYFAYEEFGRDDDTGVSYARISVTDLRTGLFVLGTPSESQSLKDDEGISEVLQSVREQTRSIFRDLAIGTPAIALAMHADGERVENTNQIEFGLQLQDGSGRISGRYELELESFDVISSSDCLLLESGVRPQGFALYFENFGQRLELHTDEILPRSRGCPISYEIKGVYVPVGSTNVQRGVAIIVANVLDDRGMQRLYLPVALGIGTGIFD